MLSLGKALAVQASMSTRGLLGFSFIKFSPNCVPMLNTERLVKMVLDSKEPTQTNDCYILDMNSLSIMVDFSTKWFFIGSLKSHIVTIATHTGPLVQNLRQLWKVECKEIISTQGFITHCYKQNSLNMFLILFSYPELFILILLSFYLDLQATRFYMLMITCMSDTSAF